MVFLAATFFGYLAGTVECQALHLGQTNAFWIGPLSAFALLYAFRNA